MGIKAGVDDGVSVLEGVEAAPGVVGAIVMGVAVVERFFCVTGDDSECVRDMPSSW